jgi:hypothetical protein
VPPSPREMMAVASLATLIDLQGNSFMMAVASFTTSIELPAKDMLRAKLMLMLLFKKNLIILFFFSIKKYVRKACINIFLIKKFIHVQSSTY